MSEQETAYKSVTVIDPMKPCPFCGGACEYYDQSDSTNSSFGRVRCGSLVWLGCGYYGPWKTSMQEAIVAHNALPRPSALAALRASIRALAAELEGCAIVGMGNRDIAKRLREIAGVQDEH